MDIATLRHLIAGLRFRLNHVCDGTDDSFASFNVGEDTRTPQEIVDHISQLADFTLTLFEAHERRSLEVLTWSASCARADAFLADLDSAFASKHVHEGNPMTLEQALHGPLLDTATHIGQLATLRRLAGSPVARVRYWQADVHAP
ncbi:MAG: hypothetical protein AAF708_23240 [Deinococcota bacterium]